MCIIFIYVARYESIYLTITHGKTRKQTFLSYTKRKISHFYYYYIEAITTKIIDFWNHTNSMWECRAAFILCGYEKGREF